MKRSRGVLMLLLLPLWMYSQNLCSGSLGENIFLNGDFGAGVPNLQVNDPGIAPGYTYTLSVPPFDGSYTITNNTAAWGSLFPTWLGISDNGPEDNGYMMVVNASFAPGIFYEEIITGLCENTLYQFSADIINIVRPPVANHIFPNVSFFIDDQLQFSTGDIAQDGNWNTYGFTFTTDPNVNQLKLSLRNNAPGGGGNDLALDNIEFRACGPTARINPSETIDLCEDGAVTSLSAQIIGNQFDTPVFQWQMLQNGSWVDLLGETTTMLSVDPMVLGNGSHLFRYVLANSPANLSNTKCRIVSEIKEVVVIPITFTLFDTICDGGSFQLGQQVLMNTGIYNDNLIADNGCDSIVTLNLEVVPASNMQATIDLTMPSCAGFSDGAIAIGPISGGTPPYTIELFDSQQTPIFPWDALAGGTYSMVIVDHFDCQTVESIHLIDPLPLVLSLGTDQSIELGEFVNLRPNANFNIAAYSWQPPNILDCTDCPNPAAQPFENTTISLIAFADSGCSITDSLNVEVTEVRKVFIPNVFTPNGDGINDEFTIYTDANNVLRILKMQIFDRWGGVLFEVGEQLPGGEGLIWDGSAKGDALDEGVYVYYAEIEFIDGLVLMYSGDLTLLR